MKVRELPDKLYKQLYSLCLRHRGRMRDVLTTMPEAEVYMIRCDCGEVVCWACVFPETYRSGKEKKTRDMMFIYTRVKDRRKGYGKALVEIIKRDYPNVKRIYCTYDSNRMGFFKAVGLKDR